MAMPAMSPTAVAMPDDAVVIVVGAGPVGQRFIKEMHSAAPGLRIKLFSGEAWRPYDRVKLSQLLARDIDESEVYNPLEESDQLQLFYNCQIVAIDRDKQQVQDSYGHWHKYTSLILALGSAPYIPDIPNIKSRNVFTFRDLQDTQALSARNLRSRHTVIIGGGLLGLETARAMQRNATAVTVVQMGKHLMNQQLDSTAGKLLEARVAALGIKVICNARASAILVAVQSLHDKQPVPYGVRLDNGQELACDTIIISTGIKPRIELALQAGLRVGRGIHVNEHLQTSDPAIYAIGECVQFGEQLYGLVAPGLEHAAIVAHQLAGQASVYKDSINACSLKVVGEQVFSMGDVNTEAGPSLQTTSFSDPQTESYRAIFTINNRLVGALSIGAWSGQQRVRASISAGRRVFFWNRFSFESTGNLWPHAEEESISNWPAAMVVCNCTGTTRGQLTVARAAGAQTIAALAECTRASTVCGSCQPLLAQFVGSSSDKVIAPSLRWLQALCIICGLLIAGLLLQGPLAFSLSVQKPGLDALWLDATTKQITGFTMLGLSVLALLLSLSKRWKLFARLGKFTSWRVFHTALGLGALFILLLHTGMQPGVNLNAWLMLDFLALLAVGVLAGLFISVEHKLAARLGKRLRGYLTWAHTLVFWPLPTLLTFHVVSVYYF